MISLQNNVESTCVKSLAEAAAPAACKATGTERPLRLLCIPIAVIGPVPLLSVAVLPCIQATAAQDLRISSAMIAMCHVTDIKGKNYR